MNAPRERGLVARGDDEARAASQGADASSAAHARVSVLVVEDEPTIRAMIVRWLRERGYETHEASDGVAALERVHSAGLEVDLLLTDVVMPGLSGPDLARALRAERPSLRVLMMSAHAPCELCCGEVADAPMLEKPFLARALVARVEQALARR